MKSFSLLLALFLCHFSHGQTAKNRKQLPGFVQINDTLFIATTETSIRDYSYFLLYLHDFKKDSAMLAACMPETNYTDWTAWDSYYSKLIKYDNPLYEIKDRAISFTSVMGYLPVVNIDKRQANEYCAFKTADYKKFFSKLRPGKKKKFSENVTFRLPTSQEWIAIASTPLKNGNIVCREYYKNDTTGQLMPGSIYEGCVNSQGVYNLTGNVAELVGDTDYAYGGSYKDPIDHCNATSGKRFEQGDHSIGFRLVAVIR
ncbi:hypothetical protein A3860_09910 [Niastella vici]|uniref:Sulfatase-modifying factor enzyme-like domain-containing protein n=1 Tax=Niastella vici TaxID=1703345 RepID=A0A1V9FF29_9BACT|nr:SUMF1/EgtB/PvdO family nonheme iron enzyme [Niastella vici]OQP56887.1 hypothetical protein A3860_09910 [Niastella vici]